MDSKVYGEGIRFERIRRITGYLVGTTDRFNTAKKAELNDRVAHETMEQVIPDNLVVLKTA